MPKKVKRAALVSALSLRAKEKKLVIVDALAFEAPKTKRLAGILKVARRRVGGASWTARPTPNLSKSARNLPKSKYLAPEGLNVYDILNHPSLVIAAGAVKDIEARVLHRGDKAVGRSRRGEGGVRRRHAFTRRDHQAPAPHREGDPPQGDGRSARGRSSIPRP